MPSFDEQFDLAIGRVLHKAISLIPLNDTTSECKPVFVTELIKITKFLNQVMLHNAVVFIWDQVLQFEDTVYADDEEGNEAKYCTTTGPISVVLIWQL